MFCKNCGNNIGEGQAFCPVCGNRVEAPATSEQNNGFRPAGNGFSAPTDFDDAPAQAVQPSNQPTYEAPAYQAPASNAPVYQAPASEAPVHQAPPTEAPAQADYAMYNGYPEFVGAVAPAPKKRKSKGLKIAMTSIASVLVICLVAGFIWWDDIYFALFASSKDKTKEITSVATENMAGSLADALDIIEDAGEIFSAMKGDEKDGKAAKISKDNMFMGMNGAGVEINLGDGVKDMIVDAINDEIGYGDMVDSSVIDWINSVGINGEFIVNNDAVGLNYGYNVNSVDIATAKCAIDFETGDIYLSSPELLNKSLKIESVIDKQQFAQLGEQLEPIMQLIESLPDSDLIEKLLSSYVDCAVSAIDGVKERDKTVTVNGVSQKQTVYSATIDAKDLVNMAKAIMKKARNDKDLHELIVSIVEMSGESTEGIIEEMQSSIDMVLEQLNSPEASAQLPEVAIDVALYSVDKEAVGFSISAQQVEFAYRNAESGGKVATELVIKTPDGEFGFSGSGTKKNGKVSADYSINYAGMDIIAITTKNLDMNKLSEGTLDGSVAIAIADGVKSGASMFGDFSDYLDYSIVVTGSDEGKNGYSLDIAINNADELFAGLTITTKRDSKQTVEIPSEKDCVVVDENADIDEFESIVELDGLVDKLDEAGLPSKYLNLLEEGINQIME